MPTLIRLLGDSTKNNTEVRNTFKEPVLIPANARVALTGLNAVISDDLAFETFSIAGTVGEFRIGIPGDGLDSIQRPLAVIDTGNYTATSFVDAFEIAANFTGTNDNRETLLGMHHTADLVEGKLSLKTYLGNMGDADFNTAGLWLNNTAFSPAATTATGFTATATASEETVLGYVNGRVPLVSSRFTATFVNADTVNMAIGACSYADVDRVYWGIRVVLDGTNRQYQYGYWDGTSTVWENIVSVTAQANDVIELDRFGAYARLKITRAGGAQAANLSRTGITRAMSNQSKDTITWFARAETNGEMDNCQFTVIDGLDPLQALQNDYINASLQFINSAGEFNSILALYCGFANERGPIVYRGNPATVTSRKEIAGLPAYPGVLVTLDGLGLLKSFDGAATAKSPANIIYSVNELQDKQQYLQIDIPQPLYLDIGNPAPINVNELRVRLFEAGGYNPLTFLGKPSFSFIITYPRA